MFSVITLIYMIKTAVIFSDKSKKEETRYKSQKQEKIILTRKDYRHLIETSYQEGKKDALKKQQRIENNESSTNWRKQQEKAGEAEAIKLDAQKKAADRQRFESIVVRHEIEIMHVKSVFPFTLFPDTLIIDTTKVTISKQQLIATEHITTIPLKDVADVTVQTVLFLASITIKYMPQATSPGMNKPIDVRISNLKRRDAIKAKEVLKGILVAKAEDINIANLKPDEIVKVLQKFGQSIGIV